MWYKMHQFKPANALWTTDMFCRCDDKSMNEEKAKVYALVCGTYGEWKGRANKKNPVKGNHTTSTLGMDMRTTNHVTVGIQERQSI